MANFDEERPTGPAGDNGGGQEPERKDGAGERPADNGTYQNTQTPPDGGEPLYRRVEREAAATPQWRTGLLCGILAVAVVLLALFGGVMIGRHATWPDTSQNNGETGGTTGGGGSSINRGELKLEVVERASGAPQDGSIPSVVSRVQNAVVEIRTSKTVLSYYGSYVESGAGSGVLIESGVPGLILTCNHVIEDADNGGITVVLADGSSYNGDSVKVLGKDSWSDLALLQLDIPDASSLTYVRMEVPAAGADPYSYMQVGETVVAIGNPLGELGGSVSSGIISALGRKVTIDGTPMTLLQTDTSVNPGNSGGGLFNMAGNLIGIVNAKSTGEAVEGIGFAIPTSDAVSVMAELYDHGYVQGRPSLGLYFSSEANAKYPRVRKYAYNTELSGGKTIESGDYLCYLLDAAGNKVEVTSLSVLRYHIATLSEENGDTITLGFMRELHSGRYQQYEVTVKVHNYVPD